MTKKASQEGEQFLMELGNPEHKKTVEKVQMISPADTVKQAIYDFYVSRMALLSEEDEFKREIEAELRTKVPELTTGQLLGLYKHLQGSANNSTKTLLDVLKPVPNATNPLTTTDDFGGRGDSFSSKISPETLQALDLLIRKAQITLGKQEEE